MVNTIGIKRNHGGKKVNVNKSLNETNVFGVFMNKSLFGLKASFKCQNSQRKTEEIYHTVSLMHVQTGFLIITALVHVFSIYTCVPRENAP